MKSSYLLLLGCSLAFCGCDSAKEAVSKVGAAAKQAADKAGTAVSKQAKEVAKTVTDKSTEVIDDAQQAAAEAVGAAGKVELQIESPISLDRCDATLVAKIADRPGLLQLRTHDPDETKAPAVFVHAATEADSIPALHDREVQARVFVVDGDGVLWDNTDVSLATLHVSVSESNTLLVEIRNCQLRNTQTGETAPATGSMTGVVAP